MRRRRGGEAEGAEGVGRKRGGAGRSLPDESRSGGGLAATGAVRESQKEQREWLGLFFLSLRPQGLKNRAGLPASIGRFFSGVAIPA